MEKDYLILKRASVEKLTACSAARARERPRCCGARDERNELATPH